MENQNVTNTLPLRKPAVKVVRDLDDVMPDRDVNFHPELPRNKLVDYLGIPLVLADAVVVEDWSSEFGVRPTAFLMLEDTGVEFTVITSWKLVVDKVRALLGKRLLPVSCGIQVVAGKDNNYYQLVGGKRLG